MDGFSRGTDYRNCAVSWLGIFVPTIQLPHNGWWPRPYQLPLWDWLNGGGKRAECIWHRRSGKDEVALHWSAVAAFERPATYWHLLPQQTQARKAIWEAVNPHSGKRRIDEAFPRELRENTRENEMTIRFKSGSMWHVVGSDNFNSLVGSPPAGVVFSEWALSDPAAWGYLRPIIAENNGWALFITTPRGKNHAKTMLDSIKGDPSWFSEVLPATGTGVFTDIDLATERREYMAQFGPDQGKALYDQEYLCSFESAVLGAYFAGMLAEAKATGRIGKVARDPLLPVRAFVDIGGSGKLADAFVIWIVQWVGQEIRVLDYYEAVGQVLASHVEWLRSHGWGKAIIVLPHDGVNENNVTGKRYEDHLRDAEFQVDPPIKNQGRGAASMRIEAVRRLGPRIWFDEVRTEAGRDALGYYHERRDDNRSVGLGPEHDWSSHAADAFGLMAIAYEEPARSAGFARELKYKAAGRY